MKTLDFFQRAYIINLPERKDRRKATEKELQKVGMQIAPGRLEFFSAIRPDHPDGFPSIGARGCFLSHLQILKQARDAGLTNVLVMEDDVFMDDSFPIFEDALIEQLRQEAWGFAYFGYPTMQPLTSPVKFVPFYESMLTTHCYGVNASILDRLITFLEELQQRPPGHPDGGPMHLDGAYNMFRERNPDILALRTSSCLVAQRSSRSDVQPTSWYENFPVTRQLVEVARAGKTLLRSQRSTLG
ncbi:glycosyltransferase involved in LPS biosynthesis [Leptolyngbyaceae cyanobacterium JSC-12]|nr:glycosyltransferase involved in LPS biosynthesis [Leptolyngbyaceae cyanobacterium JSC-12]